jgi:aspartate aminotransferase/aromatic-amino-acid transaminase
MIFDSLTPAPPDAILGLTEAFKADPNPDKINLGVGVYKDDLGATPILTSVKKAEELLLRSETTKSYLPITGSPAYAAGVADLLFGSEHEVVQSNRVAVAHTPGGTGGLRVGADFLRTLRPRATVWVSNPTWANHQGVFRASGYEVGEYRYYDASAMGLNEAGFLADLAGIPAGDIVLLHVCCHNPTGVDPSLETWGNVADIAAEAGWFPFFDFAYQGFGTSVEADRAPLVLFADRGLEFAVASSCSKNFGLYNERTGGCSLVARTAEDAANAFSHVKVAIRTNYSNPSRHGGAIVETILGSDELRAEWISELDAMRERIHTVRTDFVNGLSSRGVDRDFGFIQQQNGMFSFTGLTPEQVKILKEDHSIYMVGSGRINVAGITSSNLDRLCDTLAGVLK